ncbi:hypothetical protein Leryth_004096 [Lithospermum erythrorhizon]|nr:hypothetical protein Leryth_004096 [Lithospermum erythrorhizon]
MPVVYSRVIPWKRKRAMRRSGSMNLRSSLKRTIGGGNKVSPGGYIRLRLNERWRYLGRKCLLDQMSV